MKEQNQIPSNKLWAAQVVFWVAYFLYYSLLEGQFYGYGPAFLSTAAATLFTIVIFYVHALYLFPHFFKRKHYVRYVWYCFLLLTVMVAARLAGEYYALSQTRMFGEVAYNSVKIINRYAMGLITIAVSVPARYMYDYFQLQAKQQQIKTRQLQTEMKYLKLQINPHFLFNTLNNLLLLTRRKSDEAPGVVEKLADLMRYLLEKEDMDKVPLEEELRFIASYLELEKIRIPSISIIFEKKGEVGGYTIPPMLLIPLVENAFKHGVDKSRSDNFVSIELDIADGKLHFTVENPVRESAFSETSQKGLNNLRKRLNLLYGNDHELTAGVRAENIFTASLTIPLP